MHKEATLEITLEEALEKLRKLNRILIEKKIEETGLPNFINTLELLATRLKIAQNFGFDESDIYYLDDMLKTATKRNKRGLIQRDFEILQLQFEYFIHKLDVKKAKDEG